MNKLEDKLLNHVTDKPYYIRSDGSVYHEEFRTLDSIGRNQRFKAAECYIHNTSRPYVQIDERTYRIDMLLAHCYIPNPHNYKYVYHKDMDWKNNSLDNLMWWDGDPSSIYPTDEIWKPIDGFDGIFYCSNKGRIKQLTHRGIHQHEIIGKFIRSDVSHDGYCMACLKRGNTSKSVKIHRVVAQLFLENPNNLPEVNHIDGDKQNNCVDNLEWCTHRDNNLHARSLGLMDKNKTGKWKPVRCLTTGEEFKSLAQASRAVNLAENTIKYHIERGSPTSTGLMFEFIT